MTTAKDEQCPLCGEWGTYLDTGPRRQYLCADHKKFMDYLDQFLDENRELLGRLDDDTKIQFAESLEQMKSGQGRVVTDEFIQHLRNEP